MFEFTIITLCMLYGRNPYKQIYHEFAYTYKLFFIDNYDIHGYGACYNIICK